MQWLNSKTDTTKKRIHELDIQSEEITQHVPLGEKVMGNIIILVKGYESQSENQYV